MQSAIWAKSDICAECVSSAVKVVCISGGLSQARFKGPKPEAQRANVGGQFLGRGLQFPLPTLGRRQISPSPPVRVLQDCCKFPSGIQGVTVEEVGLSLFWVLKVTNFCTIHLLF